jgi:hypothetical protein
MNKEFIEKRVAQLQEQLKQVEANGNALIGAIAECQYWLSKLQEEEITGNVSTLPPIAQKG